jgi:hypothetical protein
LDSWFDIPDRVIDIGSQALVDPKSNEHPGRIVKTTGDGVLAELARVVVLWRSSAGSRVVCRPVPCVAEWNYADSFHGRG